MIMLRLDGVKNGEKFWVLSKMRNTVLKLYILEEVLRLGKYLELSSNQSTDDSGKIILSSLGKIINIYSYNKTN